MAMYVAKHDPDNSDDADHEWLVEYEDDGHLVELNGLSIGLAHIIAWAANQVAGGHGLLAVIGAHIRDWQPYDGPTEGVAPAITGDCVVRMDRP